MTYGPGQAYPPQPALPAGPVPAGSWSPGTVGLPIMGTPIMGPTVSPSWLAATADRERTVGVLRAGFVEGRLSQDELNERIAQAYTSRTYADLWALTADLPAGPLPYPQVLPHPQALPYPPGSAYPQGFGPPPDPALASDGSASSWQSGAALLVLAMVIFTLAALVTAIVTAHAQTGMLTPAQPGPTIVLPFHQPASVVPAPGQQGRSSRS